MRRPAFASNVIIQRHRPDRPRHLHTLLHTEPADATDADGLALLTDVEAVFTKPPDEPGAERIKVWGKGSEVVLGEKSGMGRGGMG